ncbi:uncharacterized protein B4U80_01236 [Leptotrombidium deliense]|uniref:Uncharacterized protein n=1 Tax=Leptotrombidium deliense TaxID=299467 RepID=A0A443SGR5_9ACAR|nr:uncharacterized protein B4U80_01236 [Leptotrombidium deliense]
MNFLQFSRCLSVLLKKRNVSSTVRTLLSNAYSCENEWQKRTETGVLSNVDADKFFTEINLRFAQKKVVGAVDIDIYTNSASLVQHLDDCKHLLYKFRKTRRTKDTLESTHHSVIRLFLKHKQAEDLLSLLENRYDYGLFPDDQCYNLLMDYFITENDFRNASRVAILRMIQEDFDNKLSNILSLYSLYNYLKDDNRRPFKESAKMDDDSKEAEEEEEVTYERVPYLRNEHFDDHFDITNEDHLCGKTLYLVGRNFNDILGRTSQLVGLAYYNKWSKADNLLKSFAEMSENIYAADTIKIVSQIVEKAPEDQKTVASTFLDNLKKVENKIAKEDIESLLQEKVKEIEHLEEKDISQLKEKYPEWEKRRMDELNSQLHQLMREEKLKEVKRKIKELQDRERRVYFFENINKHEIDYVEAEKYINAQKKQAIVDDDYVPPVIGDKRKKNL